MQLVNWASQSSQILRFGSIKLLRYLQFFNCVCTIVPLSIQKWNVLNAIWSQMRDKNVLIITFNSAQSPLYGILVHTASILKMEDLYSRPHFLRESRPAVPMWVSWLIGCGLAFMNTLYISFYRTVQNQECEILKLERKQAIKSYDSTDSLQAKMFYSLLTVSIVMGSSARNQVACLCSKCLIMRL